VIPLAAVIADRTGRVCWMNAAASALLGSRSGHHFTRLLTADGVANARAMFARKLHGRLDASVQRAKLNAVGGVRAAELRSVPLRDDNRILGVLTLICVEEATPAASRGTMPRLTPRQFQVLQLLAEGYSTTEIADALQVSEGTVRNHIRFLLAELRVRSRLEAVVAAFRNDWL